VTRRFDPGFGLTLVGAKRLQEQQAIPWCSSAILR
jgi:hypothetical protein